MRAFNHNIFPSEIDCSHTFQGNLGLGFYMTHIHPEDNRTHLNLLIKQRRLIAMIRFRMKHSLPFVTHDCCKFCDSFPIPSSNRWDHLINDCPTLPPLDRLTCISILNSIQIFHLSQHPPNHESNNRLQEGCFTLH